LVIVPEKSKWIGGSQAQFFFWLFPSLASLTYFGRATPLLRDEKMKRIMCRLFSVFCRRATRAEVISFPRSSRFPRWQELMINKAEWQSNCRKIKNVAWRSILPGGVEAIICLFIRSIGISKEESLANAILIQKAPELFRCLDDLNDALYRVEGDPEGVLRIGHDATKPLAALLGELGERSWANLSPHLVPKQ
jgi:hypothetical protein